MPEQVHSLVEMLQMSEHSADLHVPFTRSALWKKNNEVIQKTLSWLGFHGSFYFTPLRACFLFEIDSIQSLDYYSPIQSRDGALTLLKFFFKCPRPLTSKMLLLVPAKLENLIPEAWQPNCLLYRKVPKKLSFKTTAQRKLILTYSTLGPNQCSNSFVNSAINEIEKLKQGFDVVTLVKFNSIIDGVDELQEAAQKEQFENFVSLSRLFPDRIESKSARDLHSEDLSNSKFLDLNDLSFYYSDSAFEELILGRGAKPLETIQDRQILYRLNLSLYHELQVFEPMPILSKAARKVYGEFHTSPSLITKERNFCPTIEDSIIKLTSDEFESFAYEFTSEAIAPVKFGN